MTELRGITIDTPNGQKRVRLLTRTQKGDDYQTLDFPPGLALNEGQIREFLGHHFHIPPGKIIWPSHIKIPGEP